jgi:choice-of-anchor B domain-containing protein
LRWGRPSRFAGREICLNSNQDTVTIVDVTDKSAPVMLSRTGYEGSAYTHQGWLTEDSRHFLVGDELDELRSGDNTKTFIWDVSDLTAPELVAKHAHDTAVIDHNIYVKGNLVFQSNYRALLHLLWGAAQQLPQPARSSASPHGACGPGYRADHWRNAYVPGRWPTPFRVLVISRSICRTVG